MPVQRSRRRWVQVASVVGIARFATATFFSFHRARAPKLTDNALTQFVCLSQRYKPRHIRLKGGESRVMVS